MNAWILPVLIFLPVVCGIVLPRCFKGVALRIALTAALSAELILIELASFYAVGELTLWNGGNGLSLVLRLDGVSHIFAILFGAIWLVAGVFAFDYMRKEHGEKRFFRFYLMTLGALIGVCFSANLFTYMVFFESVTLLALPLITHKGDWAARGAGLSYLGYSMFGAALVLLGMFVLGGYGAQTSFVPGGTDISAVPHNVLIALYFVMALGFGAKAGLLPLHAWLPIAHPIAPSPGSAVLSGIITKCGVLGILRITYYLFGAKLLSGSWAQTALLILSLVTVFVGSMLALRQTHIKRRLAYSTVSQVSYALFGLFLMTQAGLSGALLQVVFHAVAKNALFLWAGAVIFQTGVNEVDGLRGIGRRMPCACWCFVIASCSLIGLPPTAGFISKWALAEAALSPAFGNLGLAGVIVLIVSALLTAAYLLPIAAAAFLPGHDYDGLMREDPPKLMDYSLLLLAGACVVLGMLPGPLQSAIVTATSGLF